MKYDKSINSEANLIKLIKAILFGTITGTFSSILILMMLSILLVQSKSLPTSIISPVTIFITALGAFVSGYTSLRIVRKNGLFLGMISGFVMFVVVFISGLTISYGEISMLALVKLILMMLMGAIGGILGVNKKMRK